MPIVKRFQRFHSNIVSSRQVATEISNLVSGSEAEQSGRPSSAPLTSNRPIRKRVNNAERREMLESFVNKYRAMNMGKFPSTTAKKEVGGHYYSIKKRFQEMEYNFKMSTVEKGPTKENKKQIRGDNALSQDIAMESSGNLEKSNGQIAIDQNPCKNPWLESGSNFDKNTDTRNRYTSRDDTHNIATESDEKPDHNPRGDNVDFKDSETKVEQQPDGITNITRVDIMDVRGISDIRPGDNAAPIEVRVIRTWLSYLFENKYCCLFVDIKGDAIEAYVNRRDKSLFEFKFCVGLCYRVSKYLSRSARYTHNVVPCVATLHLGRDTVFEPVVGIDIPHQYFNFIPYESLGARENKHFLLTDYIGRFDRLSTDTTIDTGRRLFKLVVEDASERFIEITLWEEIANRINKQALISAPFPCIVAVTAMKVGRFKNHQLGSTPATHFYINPGIEAASDLANRFREIYADINMDDRYRLPICSILAKNPTDHMEVRFSCIASIVSYNPRRAWFYKGCTVCNRKLGSQGDALICNDHREAPQPKYLYYINCTIADHTGETSVTIFNSPFESIIKIPCSELVIQQGYSDSMTIPDQFHQLLDVSRMFKLQFNEWANTGSTRFVTNEVLDYLPAEDDIAKKAPVATEALVVPSTDNQKAIEMMENPPNPTSLHTTTSNKVKFTPETPAKINSGKRQFPFPNIRGKF